MPFNYRVVCIVADKVLRFDFDQRCKAVEKVIELESEIVCEVRLVNQRTNCVEYRSRFRFGV